MEISFERMLKIPTSVPHVEHTHIYAKEATYSSIGRCLLHSAKKPHRRHSCGVIFVDDHVCLFGLFISHRKRKILV